MPKTDRRRRVQISLTYDEAHSLEVLLGDSAKRLHEAPRKGMFSESLVERYTGIIAKIRRARARSEGARTDEPEDQAVAS